MQPDFHFISSLLLFLGLLSVLIIAHEYGHFWVARRCGMKVERFGFGLPFGPTLWSKKIGDVEYCIHALLLGGYVSFPDDNPDSPVPPDSPERFENQPVWNRFAVAIAGVTVNAFLGWAIMVFVFMYWGQPVPNHNVTINNLLNNMPGIQAGLKPGDVIQKVNGLALPLLTPEERVATVPKLMKDNAGKKVTLTIVRDDKVLIVPVQVSAVGKVGMEISPGVAYQPVTNFFEASGLSTQFLSTFVKKNFEGLGKMLTGQVDPKNLSGPIEIITVGSETIAQHGLHQGLTLTAIISVILAVMNILPIPALDGGHIVFILIEAIKGSPVRRELQDQFTQLGFVGMMLLMCFVLFNDGSKLWERLSDPKQPTAIESLQEQAKSEQQAQPAKP